MITHLSQFHSSISRESSSGTLPAVLVQRGPQGCLGCVRLPEGSTSGDLNRLPKSLTPTEIKSWRYSVTQGSLLTYHWAPLWRHRGDSQGWKVQQSSHVQNNHHHLIVVHTWRLLNNCSRKYFSNKLVAQSSVRENNCLGAGLIYKAQCSLGPSVLALRAESFYKCNRVTKKGDVSWHTIGKFNLRPLTQIPHLWTVLAT